ncbi:hypothetical protein P8936_17630 [Edaphobacter paludis]|uniref:DUF748 domain-containing protein n=1 Tax=Edaphobacter paludis TaxID=3035702 RepID=A0AAU7D8Q2_9BACT
MTRPRPAYIAIAGIVVVLCLCWFFWHLGSKTSVPAPSSSAAAQGPVNATASPSADDLAPTQVYAHNILLRKGPNFRIYILWISGLMERTHPKENPSFDDPDSFVFQIQKGVIHANIGDISNYLNSASPANAPLKNISIQPDGDQIKLHGTVHKIVPLPIELVGTLSSVPDGRVKFHVTKLSVLKVPLKSLLRSFHIELSDLVHATNMPGVQIADNDIFFDTQKLLPPPHIRGQLTKVRVRPPDIEVIYGNAPDDETRLAQWHNFLRLTGGTLDFGKLTMHDADLTMIDASKDAWFDLDLVNYQAQLINGYTRMTAQAGLEIYMPDLDEMTTKKKAGQKVTIEWLKDRNRSVPSDVPVK